MRRITPISAAVATALASVPAFASDASQSNRSAMSVSDMLVAAGPARIFRAKDTFDAAPKVDLAGRRFSIDIPVTMSSSLQCVGMPSWRYDATLKKLELFFDGGTRAGSQIRGYNNRIHPVLTDMGLFHTVPISCSETRAGYYQVHNAFGAVTQVSRRKQLAVEIVANSHIKRWDEHPELSKSIEMTPSEARLATRSLRMRYEGYLTNWTSGTSVECGIERPSVDMNTVWETISDVCLFRGWVTRIAFVDSSNGKTLVEENYEGAEGE